MSPEAFVEIFQDALYIVVIMASAIILPGLFVGLIVAIFQAATSINEQTLSFLPRLLTTLLAISFMGHWLLNVIMDFMQEMVARIPVVIS